VNHILDGVNLCSTVLCIHKNIELLVTPWWTNNSEFERRSDLFFDFILLREVRLLNRLYILVLRVTKVNEINV
jgi:hypothetical protein